MEFLSHLVPAGLSDEGNSLSSDDIRQALSDIGRHFDHLGEQPFSCVGIAPRNTVGHTLLMLYFLLKKINFFILPGHTRPDARIPSFCDKVVSLRQRVTAGEDLPGMMEWQDNPGFEKEKCNLPAAGAVIVMSSGSTGQPKFVYFQADKIWANAANCAERFRLNGHSRVLIPVPIAHMFGLGAGLLPAWMTGANICLIEKSNVVKLFDRTAGFRPDLILVTPTLCKMYLLLNKQHGGNEIYVTAGERIKKDVYLEFESRYGRLINLYGSTEMGAMATSGMDDPTEERITGAVKPLGKVEIDLAGAGKGEILCRHPAAFDHYIDEYGNMTAGQNTGSSWYPTRDLGSRADGKDSLLVLGRMDNCINRSGFLVSLQEIEARLEDLFCSVNQAIVLEGGGETMKGVGLIAVFELKRGETLEIETARELCRSKLPGHWIPDQFHFVPEIPRLANGKADRWSLSQKYSTIISK